MNSDPVPATSTNNDIYVVPITGRAGEQDHLRPGVGIGAIVIRRMAGTSRTARRRAGL